MVYLYLYSTPYLVWFSAGFTLDGSDPFYAFTMSRSVFVFTLLLAMVAGAFGAKLPAERRSQQNSIPDYPFDPSTTRYCTWWIDGDGELTCEDVQELFGVSVADFLRWV